MFLILLLLILEMNKKDRQRVDFFPLNLIIDDDVTHVYCSLERFISFGMFIYQNM